jgi:P4 family phage/plasmid primase-like protien
MTTELSNFLKPYISTGQKDENGKAVFTHTSLQPKVSYNIPMDKRDTLHYLIADSIHNRKPIYLTEKPLKIKPITIDIDLKYSIDCTTRQHDERHIKELLKLYSEAIITFVDLPEDYNIDAYVFQRKNPYPKNGNIKDGLHIMYPDICIDTDIQHVIRTEVLKKIDQFLDNPEIGILPVKNTRDDVVDIAVVSSGNWMMYGCMKPALRPYKLHGIFRLDNTGEDMQFSELQTDTSSLEDIATLINHLSTHNVTEKHTFDIRDELRSVIDEYVQKSTARRQRNKYNSANFIKKSIKSVNDDEDVKCQIDEAKSLTLLLADWRAEAFHHWIEVGLCLHNISPSLRDTWIEFSKRSDAFDPNQDGDRWHGFTNSKVGLNVGSLHRWARLDNPQKYKEVRSKMLRSLMMSSVSGSSQDVSAVIHKMYKHQYVCIDAKGRRWAEFVNHSWHISNEGMSLKKKIGHEVLNEYLMLITFYNITAIEHDDEKKEQYLHRSKSLTEVTYKLRDISFKEKIMKECIIMFHDPTFEESLNSDPYLIGMENGVYDLKRGVFRDGQPEDRVSITTGNDFPDFDESDVDIDAETSNMPAVQAIFDFMKQVFPLPAVRRYMFMCLASYIEGYNREEKFHLWTGVGGNGKSKLLSLFEMAYGDYTFKLPINLLTKARSQPGQATPELATSRGRRFGSLQEPDEGAKINTGLMKEYSGNDKLYWRGLYAEGGVMKPQFSLVLLCNHKPKMTSDDEGTWRRLVVIEFIARFVEGKAKNKYEFARNIHLDQQFPEWAPLFFAMLTMYYKVYKKDGLSNLPQEIVDATYDYRKQSDAYAMFMDDYFCKEDEGIVKLDDSYTVFKDWYSNEFSEKAPARREYKAYVERKLNQQYGRGNKSGWYGYSLQHPDSMDLGSTTNGGPPGPDMSGDLTSKSSKPPKPKTEASMIQNPPRTPIVPKTPLNVPRTPVKFSIKNPRA